jgi:hypothetical protein
MQIKKSPVDIVEEIPAPDVVRVQIRESVRRTDLLRAILRLSVRKAVWDGEVAARGEVRRGANG